MNTKTLSSRALSVIDQYRHFAVGSAVCNVPYFNNKASRARATLRTYGGKGSPKDIFEEVQGLMIKSHISPSLLNDEALKKMLVENNIGIDCSGFAYYVLNAENEERGYGSLDKHIHFTSCKGIVGKIRCHFRPVENCDVATFANDKNSRIIAIKEIQVGDVITMLAKIDSNSDTQIRNTERDHILIIHQVDYQNFVPIKIYYSHTVAYPEDGLYGTGVKQGSIEILDLNKSITEQSWSENESDTNNRIFNRAQISNTEVRRVIKD
ncbi:MAG: hypothetical protein WCW03_02140 [Candidatus Paceibacterota bacterium]|jgi:hypothetical protein